jgi:hypothetical protein
MPLTAWKGIVMKNTIKLFGNLNRAHSTKVPLLIIALVAVIGFTMAACDLGEDEDLWDPGPYTTLTLNQWSNGSFTLQRREQWDKFTATANAPAQYFHWYSENNSITGSSVYVELHDIGGILLEKDKDFYWGNKTQLTVTSGTTYFIKVAPGLSATTGTFKIAFNASETAPANP